MVGLCHDLTKLACPQGWIEKAQVPCVDEIFKERLQGMLIDLQASMESEDEDKVDFSYLDKGTTNFLQSRLSSFFQIIGMTQNVERRRKAGFCFCGKDHQLAWNALLCVFCSSEEDAVPRNLFFEKMIRYPPSNIRPAEATTDQYLSSALPQARADELCRCLRIPFCAPCARSPCLRVCYGRLSGLGSNGVEVVPPAKRAGPLARPTANTYVMDHNLASFDISVPTEALQFAVALYRINQHQEKILDSLLGLGIFSKVPARRS
ncbi:unnamed protein product [Cyclocybe aegerita]|uniref:Uncharacterized protein n=1 Tax=Cyclocybe aegerita TaxID=1973307 RepID=A0A8S0VRF2_CYCAE|nr:unnamed protein product [Cyclocybe aegerita]